MYISISAGAGDHIFCPQEKSLSVNANARRLQDQIQTGINKLRWSLQSVFAQRLKRYLFMATSGLVLPEGVILVCS